MKSVFAGLLGVALVVCAGTAQGQADNAKKIADFVSRGDTGLQIELAFAHALRSP